MNNKIFLTMLLFSTATFFNVPSAADSSLLLGKWFHTYGPDGDTLDLLSFKESGKFVTTEVSPKRQIKGVYFMKKNLIKINLIYKGSIFSIIKLTFDKNKLFYFSSDTGNSSDYIKTGS